MFIMDVRINQDKIATVTTGTVRRAESRRDNTVGIILKINNVPAIKGVLMI